MVDVLERLEKRSNTRAILMFVDAEKAFDNISWNFMKQNFYKMEMGGNFYERNKCNISRAESKNHC